MNGRSRTKVVYINSVVTLFNQIIQVLLGFVIRKLFITYLGVTYLGYNSVFANILQMLNLADMGIGVAITSFLYKPLAEDSKDRIKALMYIYKRVYEMLGAVVLIIGVIVSFFLQILIPDATCSVEYLRLLFYINLAATVSTYYLSYKRTLLIADQKSYITSLVDTVSYFVTSLIQLFILIFFPNYIIYLVITVAKNVISNIIVSIKSDKAYGRIGNQRDNTYYMEYKPQVLAYVKDVFVSRIGAFIYYSTDNIIISVFKGSLLTGYLSNYTLITTQVSNVINQILVSIQATFGNYISVNTDIAKQREMTDSYLTVHYCIGNFCYICLLYLIQPFIQIVFGIEFILSISTAMLLAVNVMLTIMIQLPSQLFMIYKLYKYDKPIIVTSASLNIIISCALVKNLGVDGVLIGTFLTSLLYLFSRFYIISKKVYRISYIHYLKKFVRFFTVTLFSTAVVYLATRNIDGTSVKSFIARMIGVGGLAIFIPSTCLCLTKEFQFLVNKFIPTKIKKYYSKRIVCIIAICLTVALLIVGGGE